jgi:hypothetical protein
VSRNDQPSPPPLQPGQFSLLGLLSFMLAWSIYFSMIATFAVVVAPTRGHAHGSLPLWRALVPCVAWVTMALLYQSWGLRRALIVHCFVPVVVAGLLLVPALALLGDILHGTTEHIPPVGALFVGVCLICYASVLISLPVATAILLYRVLTRNGP